MIKVTLSAVKNDIKADPALKSAPKTILYHAVQSFMNHVKENPDEFTLTPSSEKAINKWMEGLITNE